MSARLGLEGVSKRFGEQAVLDKLTLDFPLGKATCLMGPSGIGKTTVLRLLMGLEQPDTGIVHRLAPVSAVFQEDRLLMHLSAAGNLRLLAGRGQDARIIDLLAQLGLHEAADKPVRDFSGGMKRRVVLARALLADFDVLLLDEPFKGLDEDSRALAATAILRRAAGKTLVMVSHDPDEAALLGAHILTIN